jgi:hypothetical protein
MLQAGSAVTGFKKFIFPAHPTFKCNMIPQHKKLGG